MAKEGDYSDMDYGLTDDVSHFQSNDDDLQYDDDAPVDTTIPTADSDADEEDSAGGLYNVESIISNLSAACKEIGVIKNEEMNNVVVATSATYSIDEDSMRWFVAGIMYSNNQRMIPQMTTLIEELRAEVKAVQSVNTSLKSISSDIVKKMISVKDEIYQSFENLKGKVLDKMEGMMLSYKNIEIESDSGEAEKKQADKLPPAKVTNKHKINDGASTSKSKPMDQSKVWQPKTKVDAEGSDTLSSLRKKLLIRLGGIPSTVMMLNSNQLQALVTADELIYISEHPSDQDELSMAYEDEILTRVMMLEQELS